MRLGLAQMDMIWEDKEANYQKAEQYIIEGKEKGVELLLFPEMSMTGFSMHVERIGEAKEAPVTRDYFCALAKKYGMYIGIGYVERKENKRGRNRYAILSPEGEVLCDYAKIHPFTYGREGEYYDGGDALSFCMVEDCCVSPLICYDLRFPEVFQAASGKADMIVVPASWPEARMDAWEIFLKARALENQCIMVGINRVGMGGKIPYVGKSMAVDAEGKVLGGPFLGEGLFTVDVDTASVKNAREVFPTKKDRKDYVYRMLGIE